jgi:small basic protein
MITRTRIGMTERQNRTAGVVGLAAVGIVLTAMPATGLPEAAALFVALATYATVVTIAVRRYEAWALSVFIFSAGFAVAAVVVCAVALYRLALGKEDEES